MFAHYLAVALATFGKNPFTTAANVLTLALGLACFVAAYGIATYWSSGDGYHPGSDRIVYVCSGCEGAEPGSIHSPGPLAEHLREDMPELEVVGRVLQGQLAGAGDMPVSTGETKLFLPVMPADREIFDIFSFQFVEGTAETALRAPDDVVLTVDAAQRLFGTQSALGQTVRIDGTQDANVSAVIAPVRQPSFMGHAGEAPIRFEIIVNLSTHIASYDERSGAPLESAASWGFVAPTTVVRLPPGMPIETFQVRLDDFAERILPRDAEGRPQYDFTAYPVAQLTTMIVDGRFLEESNAGVTTGAILLGLGLLILTVACVNYANLSAAQARRRLKEAGMRKVLGAGRLQLLAQHMLEAGLLTLPALALAVLVVALTAPLFRNLLGVDATYFLTSGPRGVVVLAVVAVISALAAAIYPALTLSRARASDALGDAPASGDRLIVARALVGLQFLSASFLIIVVTVAQLQHAHITDLAFDPRGDRVVVLNDLAATDVAFETLAAELGDIPQVQSMTAAWFPPWNGGANWFGVSLSGEAGAVGLVGMSRLVGPGYVETVGLDVIAGRALDPAQDRSGVPLFSSVRSGSVPVMIDRRLADSLDVSAPEAALGRTVHLTGAIGRPSERPGLPVGEIVGVVETIHPRLDAGAAGVMLALDPDYERARIPVLRIDRDDAPEALAAIERVWDRLAPDIPLSARFDEELFEEAYEPFHKIAGVFVALSICALVISTTGLLGMAMHVVARRRREMGIRKTLGATALGLGRQLLTDFSRPILVANLLAWPLGYLAAQAFIEPFADPVPLTPAPFLLSMAITLLIAWAAVLGEVLKAASVRPAEVLRHA